MKIYTLIWVSCGTILDVRTTLSEKLREEYLLDMLRMYGKTLPYTNENLNLLDENYPYFAIDDKTLAYVPEDNEFEVCEAELDVDIVERI